MEGPTKLPLARSQDLIIEELGDEILVYDSKVDKGHCLSRDAARVWQRCDGRTPAEGLAAQVGLDLERVESALAELASCELLEEGEGHTRRELGVKAVTAGAAIAATPLIMSVLAPTPAMAATINQCIKFSSNNCGGSTSDGCSSTTGCCCCTPPLHPPFPANGPCATFSPNDPQCKSCVPCDLQTTLCPQFGHGAGTACGNETQCP
jgi:hypothetical protein